MSRALTRREKVLMALMAVLLVVLTYYLLVYQPVQKELAMIEIKQLELQSDMELEAMINRRLEHMREELEALKQGAGGELPPMAEFDNAQNVMTELSGILSAATDYDLSFSPVEAEGALIRRSIGMSFVCGGYEEARTIVGQLAACRYRCQIGDLSITAKLPQGAAADRKPDLTRDSVQVNLTVVFYELAA